MTRIIEVDCGCYRHQIPLEEDESFHIQEGGNLIFELNYERRLIFNRLHWLTVEEMGKDPLSYEEDEE